MASLTTPKGEDRISELPNEILISILSRLTLREAVRTSVLSKQWRYVWTYISALNFDAKLNKLSWFSPPPGNAYKYRDWVDGVLEKLRGPNIDEFRISYDLDNTYDYIINRWIKFSLSNTVHTIDLNCSYESLSLSSLRSRLPFVPCRRCYVPDPYMFMKFKSLKSLSLSAVTVDDEAIACFLSNFRLLERLSIHLNVGLRNLEVVGGSLVLRHLEVVKCWNVERVEICDANLVSFTYDGSMSRLFIKNVPQLVEVSVNPNGAMCIAKTRFLKLSCCFSQLEILRLTVRHGEPVSLSDITWPELKNLKQFELFVDTWSNDNLLVYLAMIKNWPNLQRFVFQVISREFHYHNKERIDTTEDVREAARFCHPDLKMVEISRYCNICDFEIFKQIIENFVNLEKIIIDTCDPDRGIKSESESERESKEDQRELQRSSLEQQLRAQLSPRVELVML